MRTILMQVIPTLLLFVSCMKNYAASFDVQGHRGERSLFPENTLPAFIAAIEAGAHTLELDLHITSDGEIVIHHDYMTHDIGAPLIRSLKLSEVKKMDCGSKTDPNFLKQRCMPGIQIPTLDELFATIDKLVHPNAKNIRLNLEIKRDPRHPELSVSAEELATKIVSKVREKGFSQRVYYSSFDPEVLTKIYQLDPQATLGFLFDKDSLIVAQKIHPENPMGLLLKLAKSFNAKIVSPSVDLLTEESFVHFLHQLGFQVVPWTVNSPEQWTKCIEMGVDGLITDYPQDLVMFLKQTF